MISDVERSYTSIEFEAEVGSDGNLKIPKPIARKLRTNARVTVRLTEGSISTSLRQRNVTEEEVERIASRQGEERDSVLRFLMCEGQLAKGQSFKRRAASLIRQKL